jgi:hypothetical protein
MRRSYFRLLEGVLLSLPLLFASCGNGDNALEEIINGGGSGSGGGSSTINATAIKLSQTMKVIKLGGDALTITATVTPTDATLTWESSDEAVATVANGVVTPKSVGIATITAKSGDVKATCEVFVGNEVALSAAAYEAKNYDIVKGDMGDYQLTIPAGYHVALDGLTINGNNITCSGDATIYLTDGSTNAVTAPVNDATAIKIGGAGTTLTINAETLGTGILNAIGGSDGAGIGTEYAISANVVGGNITINGGVINATGKGFFRGAAGIGTGGAYTGYKNECGAITINGGVINATGGYGVNNGIGGAGIGTGGAGAFNSSSSAINKCGAITINGGTVTATGAERAVGIGTGTSYCDNAPSNNTCGAITIGTGITSVAAIKGEQATRCIGKGPGMGGASATTNCGVIKFGTAEVYDGGGDWTTYNSMTAGTYGGLTLAISTTTESNDTWTLTPAE